jgi:chromosome segregation ATPase
MSLVTELLERLAGVAILKEKVNDTAERVDRLAEWLLELDRRVTRVEMTQATLHAPARLPRK